MGVFGKPQNYSENASTKDKLFGRSTIYSGSQEDRRPYMTRFFFGRLRFHVFHRGDADPDHHDHPWGFWTFPFTSYVEEVLDPNLMAHAALDPEVRKYRGHWTGDIPTTVRVVKAFRLHRRESWHAHKVLGRYAGMAVNLMPPEGWPEGKLCKEPVVDRRPIYTLVFRDKGWDAKWGFWKKRSGKLCWSPWRRYVNEPGHKDAPCS